MKITNLRRQYGAGSLVALFDLEATPEIQLNDWQLRHTSSGMRAFPPSPRHGRSTATVAPDLFAEISRMAATEFKGGSARKSNHAA